MALFTFCGLILGLLLCVDNTTQQLNFLPYSPTAFFVSPVKENPLSNKESKKPSYVKSSFAAVIQHRPVVGGVENPILEPNYPPQRVPFLFFEDPVKYQHQSQFKSPFNTAPQSPIHAIDHSTFSNLRINQFPVSGGSFYPFNLPSYQFGENVSPFTGPSHSLNQNEKDTQLCMRWGRLGDCESRDECRSRGGSSHQYCLGDYTKSCCLFLHTKCGGRSRGNIIHIENLNYPFATRYKKGCSYTIEKAPDMCGLRFKFDRLRLPGQTGSCDYVSASVDGIPRTKLKPLCGDLSYSSYDVNIERANSVSFSVNAHTPKFVVYTIKIEQLRCSDLPVTTWPRDDDDESESENDSKVKPPISSPGVGIPLPIPGIVKPKPEKTKPKEPEAPSVPETPVKPQVPTKPKPPKEEEKKPDPAPQPKPPMEETKPPMEEAKPPMEEAKKPDPVPQSKPQAESKPSSSSLMPQTCGKSQVNPTKRVFAQPTSASMFDRHFPGAHVQSDFDSSALITNPFLKTDEWDVPTVNQSELYEAAKPLSPLDGRITFGKRAKQYEYPWQIVMYNNGRFHCSGSIISQKEILTAAHCVHRYRNFHHSLKITIGDYNVKTQTDGKNIIGQIDKIIVHEGYSARQLKNDIAIVRLKKPLVFSRRVQPVCLPPANLNVEGKLVTVTGWGRNENNRLQPILMKHSAVVVSNSLCNRRWKVKARGKDLIRPTMLCMDPQDGDSCKGDSGGPTVMRYPENSDSYAIVGVVSFGSASCTDKQLPGVYTRVTSMLPWIKKHITS